MRDKTAQSSNSSEESKASSSRQIKFLALGLASLIVLVDQLIKELLIATLEPQVSYPFLGDVVRLYLTFNEAAAFSIGIGQTWIFAVLAIVASLVVLWYLSKIQTRSWAILAGVALGGIVGNLVDRLTRDGGWGNGLVVDYIQIPFNFAIFNLADVAIVSAAITIALRVTLGHKLGGESK